MDDSDKTAENDALYDEPWRKSDVGWHPKTQIRVERKAKVKAVINFMSTSSGGFAENEGMQTLLPVNQRRDLSAHARYVVKLLFDRFEITGIAMIILGTVLFPTGKLWPGVLLQTFGLIPIIRYSMLNCLSSLQNSAISKTMFKLPLIRMVMFSCSTRDRDTLRSQLENYEPLQDLLNGETMLPHVNILLMGPVGAGKSSFYNTISSIFRNKIFSIARSGSSEHSLTTKFRRYPVISSSNNKLLKFCLCDAMGLENNHLMQKQNMKYLLQGHIQDRFMLDPSAEVSQDIPGFNKRPSLEDQIHCVAIVLDASIVDAADAIKDTVQNIKEMQVVMNSADVPQVVLLTCIDKICKETKDNPSNALKSKLVHRTVEKVSEMFGLQQNCIFPLKNYEKECMLDPNIDILALLALKGILNSADAFLFLHRDEILENYSS